MVFTTSVREPCSWRSGGDQGAGRRHHCNLLELAMFFPLPRFTLGALRRVSYRLTIANNLKLARRVSTVTEELRPADEIKDVRELDRLLELVRSYYPGCMRAIRDN